MPSTAFSFDTAIADSQADDLKALDQATGKVGAIIAGVRSAAVEGRADIGFTTHLLASLAEGLQSESGATDALRRLLSRRVAPAATAIEAAPNPDSPSDEDLGEQLSISDEHVRLLEGGLEELASAFGLRVTRNNGRLDLTSTIERVSGAIDALRENNATATAAKAEAEAKLSAANATQGAIEQRASEATSAKAAAETRANEAEALRVQAEQRATTAEAELVTARKAKTKLDQVRRQVEALRPGVLSINAEDKQALLDVIDGDGSEEAEES